MARKLKVFGTLLSVHEATRASNGNKQSRCIVATTSRAAAAELFHMSDYELSNYGCETGNKEEIRLALSEPNVVFWRNDNGDKAWRKLERV